MKRFLAIAIAATMGLFYVGTANAQMTIFQAGATGTQGVDMTGATDGSAYTPGLSANGVVASRHNLGAFGRHVVTRNSSTAAGDVTGTTQICVFCHTPHHSNTDARPLWNRNMPNSGSYQAYGTTIAGTSVATIQAGSASLACLSCHDGVTALDNLVNAPGRGTAMPATAWTFGDEGGANILTSNNLGFNTRVVLGTDLTNDHPVNITYNAGTAASLRATNTTISQINLSAGLANTTAYFNWMTTNNWAVSGFISSTATIAELLRADNSTGGSATKVECSSCHDPHFSNGSYPEYTRDSLNNFTGLNVADGMFLRRVGGNMGSGVCRTCHDK